MNRKLNSDRMLSIRKVVQLVPEPTMANLAHSYNECKFLSGPSGKNYGRTSALVPTATFDGSGVSGSVDNCGMAALEQ
jgi:hypothetical protein